LVLLLLLLLLLLQQLMVTCWIQLPGPFAAQQAVKLR
jgi:hypothetical protein